MNRNVFLKILGAGTLIPLFGSTAETKKRIVKKTGEHTYAETKWSDVKKGDTVFIQDLNLTKDNPDRYLGPIKLTSDPFKNDNGYWTINCNKFDVETYIIIPEGFWTNKKPGDMLACTVEKL